MYQIEKLTEKQEKMMPIWADKWIKIGLSTEEADWNTFEENVVKCYKFAGLNPNVPIIRVQSPIVGAFASSIARELLSSSAVDLAVASAVYTSVDSAVESDVDSAVESAVGLAVASAVYTSVDTAVGSAMESSVYSAVDSSVGSPVAAPMVSAVDLAVDLAVDSSVESAVKSAVRSAVHSVVVSAVGLAVHSAVESAVYSAVVSNFSSIKWHRWFGGRFWVCWQAYVTYFLDVCGLKLSKEIQERARAYELVQKSVNYWWPNKNFIMVCNAPCEIHLQNNRLHKDGSMAIKYRDGWGLWFLNGVRVSKEIAETPANDLDSKLIVEEKNAQVRSEIIKKIGYSRILKDLKAKHMDSWREYELYRIDDIDVEPMFLVKFNCPSTGAYYAQRVPPDTRTCEEAMRWINWGISPKEFLIET